MLPNLIVPVLNRYDLLQRMLDSVDYPIKNLLIIDNGGEADSLFFPSVAEEVHFIQLPSNLGVAGSWNLGIKLLPHDDRWFFTSNDVVFGDGALFQLSLAERDEITLSDKFPYWHTFAVGDMVVEEIGLFDEGLYPAYFEDNDYRRRAEKAGIGIVEMPLAISHDNSSTINSDGKLAALNAKTFAYNSHYYGNKCAWDDYTEGGWKLHRRREAAWDKPPIN